jgi:protein-tyrosine phosphatase
VLFRAERPFGPANRYSWITSYLMLGAQPERRDLPALRRAGIAAVLSVRDDDPRPVDHYRRLGFAFCQVPVPDFTTPSVEQLAACCAFIDEQRLAGHAVLVHCALGVQRSATICLAYLMREGRSQEIALELLRERRPCVGPSASQVAAAAAFALMLREQHTAQTVATGQ